MARISRRSATLGRSTKKSSSKRPRRSSSGGSPATSLAVATTNTGERFSESQVRKVPRMRDGAGSRSVAAKPFSISSIQSTAGASDSATCDRLAQHRLGALRRRRRPPPGRGAAAGSATRARRPWPPATCRSPARRAAAGRAAAAARSWRASSPNARLALRQPALQLAEPADLREPGRIVVEGERRRAAQRAALVAHDLVRRRRRRARRPGAAPCGRRAWPRRR